MSNQTPVPEPIKEILRNRAEFEGQDAIYGIFMFGMSLLALVVAIALLVLPAEEPSREILKLVDNLFAVVLLLDFLYRLRRSKNHRAYLRWGWADLLSGIPGLTLFRFFRVFYLWRVLRILRTFQLAELEEEVSEQVAQAAALGTLLITVTALLIASILVVKVESQNPAATIQTSADAIWWALVTVTTVGYGDYAPVTTAGRVIAALLMLVGVGVFGVLSSYLASVFLRPRRDHRFVDQGAELKAIRAEMAEIKAMLHTLTADDRVDNEAGDS